MKIYPSSFAMPSGVTTHSDYPSGCPRYFVFRSHLPHSRIDPLYQAVGRVNEELQVAKLKRRSQDVQVEVPIKVPLKSGVVISGRMDAIVDGDCIYEFKSTPTKSKYYSVIRKGQTNWAHLGQLITYMALAKIYNGVLSTSYLHFDKDLKHLEFETRETIVKLDPDGSLIVDGEDVTFTAIDVLRFYKIMEDALLHPQLPPQTSNKKACGYCPFNKVCAKNPKGKEEFIREVKHNTGEEQSSSYVPTIQSHNVKRS